MAVIENDIEIRIKSKEQDKPNLLDREVKLSITGTELFHEKGILAQSSVANSLSFGAVAGAKNLLFSPSKKVNLRIASAAASGPTFSLSATGHLLIGISPGKEVLSLKVDNDQVLGATDYDLIVTD